MFNAYHFIILLATLYIGLAIGYQIGHAFGSAKERKKGEDNDER